jgi:hypothetical protein
MNATILATVDGGKTWVKQITPAGLTSELFGVHFVDQYKGWVVGYDTTILATVDGGKTWVKQITPAGLTSDLSGVHFVDQNKGWAVGNNATILATVDGGKTWVKQTTPTGLTSDLSGVHFVDQYKGCAVGDNGTILETIDAGKNWIRQASLTGLKQHLNSVHFVGQNNGWAVGDAATIQAKYEKGFLSLNSRFDLIFFPGRIYVDGILCESETSITYWSQPDYPHPTPIEDLKGKTSRTDLIYLDVWQRHITAIEDPEIREIALVGPDTTTRLKTVWQVKIVEIDVNDCWKTIKWDELIPPSSGRLSTGLAPVTIAKDPCKPAPSGGYQGLENRLYRVEIHDGGGPGKATFKWSRDNGSVVFPILKFDTNNTIKLKRLGKDQILTIHKGDWVEVLDDASELLGQPGTLAQVIDPFDETQLTIALSKNLSGYDLEGHPKVRRWDQNSDAITVITTGPIVLEEGIQIQFSGDNFKTGDFWIFAARTATGDVEHLNNASPMGIEHHYCQLGRITWRKDPSLGLTADVRDCRKIFSPLTEPNIFYIGGDGQEAMPGNQLPEQLQVGVANKELPVPNAHIKFELEDDGSSGDRITSDTITGPDGIARCTWTLGKSKPGRVIATLRDGYENQIGLPVFFNANLSIASNIYFDPKECGSMSGGNNVQDAISNLCKVLGREPGIYIRAISISDRDLRNDDNVYADDLEGSINVICGLDDSNETLNISTVSPASFFLTVDMPFPLNNADLGIWAPSLEESKETLIGFQPIILNSSIEIVGGNTLKWNPMRITIPFLKKLLEMMIDREIGDRLLARLILKGNFIWSGDPLRRYYLDGEAFGTPADETSSSLMLSGDGKRGGDFEMWFWISLKMTLSVKFATNTVTLVESKSQDVKGTVIVNIAAPVSGWEVDLSSDRPNTAELITPTITMKHKDYEAQFTIRAKGGGGSFEGIPVRITAILKAFNKAASTVITVKRIIG